MGLRFGIRKFTVLAGALAMSVLGPQGPAMAGDTSNDVNFANDVIYQIMTDRFHDGDATNNPSGSLFSSGCADLKKYCGGDWAGIVQKIQDGYLTGMGVTALWISQPVENIFAVAATAAGDTSYHGFWARDFKRANPIFGSMADFDNLIAVAHAAGIKVVIDFAPNHTSPSSQGNPAYMEDGILNDNGTFVASLNNDPSGVFHHNGGTNFSSYEDGIYRGLFDLADLDQQNATADIYLKNAINLWLDKGIDGIRVDAVKHIPFGWSKSWMDSIFAHRPVFAFGEWFLGAGEIDPLNEAYANNSGMSLLDFRFTNEIRSVLKFGTSNWHNFDTMIAGTATAYHEVIDQVTFIDNHDMSRFNSVGADTRRTDMALAVTLTSRGTPVVYYGTEQYMTGDTDPSNRGFMTGFSTTTRGYQIVKKLAALRQANKALGYGTTQQRWISNDVYIYERNYAGNSVLVAVNSALSGSTNITGLFTSMSAGVYQDQLSGLLSGNAITVNANGSVNAFALAAGEVAVWQKTSAATAPVIGHVGPMMARAGQSLTIDGEGFGAAAGALLIGGTAATISSWSDTQIKILVPTVTPGHHAVNVRTSGNVVSAAYPDLEVLSGKQVSVRFVVNNATTFVGQNIFLTGSVHELSNWSSQSSTAIGPFFNQVVHQYPTWYYDVSVPAGQTIGYKFIKLNSAGAVTWEGGTNHSFTAPASGTMEVNVNWQN